MGRRWGEGPGRMEGGGTGQILGKDLRPRAPEKPWPTLYPPLTMPPPSPRAAWTGWTRSPWTWGRHCPPSRRLARLAVTGRPHAQAVLVRWGWPHEGRGVDGPRPDGGPFPPESALSAQRTSPPTPAMYKFRPAFPTGPKAPFCGPGEQVRKPGPTYPEALPRRPHPPEASPPGGPCRGHGGCRQAPTLQRSQRGPVDGSGAGCPGRGWRRRSWPYSLGRRCLLAW